MEVTLRTLYFHILPGMGTGTTQVSGTLKDLLLSIPYLLQPIARRNIIPPIEVINEILSCGIKDSGMSGGCKWKPFKITAKEHTELIEELETMPEPEQSRFGRLTIVSFKFVEPPTTVKSYNDWQQWRLTLDEKSL